MKNKKQKILLVDDEQINIKIILGLFERLKTDEYEILVALNGKTALRLVEKKDVDLILLDIEMPGVDGYEVCKILKKNKNTKDIPILFITANSDEASLVKAYNLGAVDYVTKPFKPLELLARVKINLRLNKTIKELEYLSYYDPMTDIYNRRKFFLLAKEVFTENSSLYAVLFDIDDFKYINDTHGHAMGDEVIKYLTKIVSNELKSKDIFGRLGGDEFSIILCDYFYTEVRSLLNKIREILNKNYYINEDQIISFTISIGVAKKREEKNIDELLLNADKNLYKAKEEGKDKIILEEE